MPISRAKTNIENVEDVLFEVINQIYHLDSPLSINDIKNRIARS